MFCGLPGPQRKKKIDSAKDWGVQNGFLTHGSGVGRGAPGAEPPRILSRDDLSSCTMYSIDSRTFSIQKLEPLH